MSFVLIFAVAMPRLCSTGQLWKFSPLKRVNSRRKSHEIAFSNELFCASFPVCNNFGFFPELHNKKHFATIKWNNKNPFKPYNNKRHRNYRIWDFPDKLQAHHERRMKKTVQDDSDILIILKDIFVAGNFIVFCLVIRKRRFKRFFISRQTGFTLSTRRKETRKTIRKYIHRDLISPPRRTTRRLGNFVFSFELFTSAFDCQMGRIKNEAKIAFLGNTRCLQSKS